MCWFLGLGLSLAIPTSQKPFLFTIYGTPLLGTPGWVVAPPHLGTGYLQGVLGMATVDEWMDDRAERPGARVWSPRPSPGQLGMSQEGPDWATERERNTENLEPGSCPPHGDPLNLVGSPRHWLSYALVSSDQKLSGPVEVARALCNSPRVLGPVPRWLRSDFQGRAPW